MIKYFTALLVFFVCVTNADAFYSPDLQNAAIAAANKCKQSITPEITTYIPNTTDSATVFTCSDGEVYLLACPTTTISVPYYFLFDTSTDNCEDATRQSPDEIEEKRANGDYAGVCFETTKCDCRDNPRNANLSGTCKCAIIPEFGYGLQMNYNTCFETPTCPTLTDINGINRTGYDASTSACVAAKGYTFSNSSGKFEFTSNCPYSN